MQALCRFGLAIVAGLWLIAGIVMPVQLIEGQSGRLLVAYIDGDALYGWQSNGGSLPSALATGRDTFTQVHLSPGGLQVAYDRGGTLWTVSVAGNEPPRSLVTLDMLNLGKTRPRFVLKFAWLDEHVILFNTYAIMQNGPDRQQFADDLWRVDVLSGKITRLMDDGQGGMFAISPDGQRIAIVQPGDYATQRSGSIQIIDPDAKNRLNLLSFPVINSASSSSYYPHVLWSADSQNLFAAIPDPQLITATSNLPTTSLYRWQVGSRHFD